VRLARRRSHEATKRRSHRSGVQRIKQTTRGSILFKFV
jgi:hypothetical protein